jgi:uncharacterized iron-regulated membrane protein
MRRNLAFRKVHYWGAIAASLPVLVMIVSGVLLMLKKDWGWVQPPEQPGSGTVPAVTLDWLLEAARSVPDAGIASWDDVDRFDIRPGKGIAKIQGRHTLVEVQVDLVTGEVLQSAIRRSDLLEAIHDGSWFHERVKLGLFLPAGLVLLALWVTGMYLFFLPVVVRARRRRNPRMPASVRSAGD